MAETVQEKTEEVKITGGYCDVLILAPKLSKDFTSGKERLRGKLCQEDIETLKKDEIPKECWSDEIKIVEARLQKDFHTLRSCVYTHDRDEYNTYSVVNTVAEDDLTIGTATDAIIKLQKSKKGIVLVFYFGNGRESDGAWCFKHGHLTFEDILRLYKEYFIGKQMTILSDCPSSHQWIQRYHIHLDCLKIRPCGHYGRKAGKFLQIIATSSQDGGCPSSNVFAIRGLYTDEHGVTSIHSDGFEISAYQHLSYCSPFLITCDAEKTDDPCTLPEDSTWCQNHTVGQTIAIITNKDCTKWAYVDVRDDQDVAEVQQRFLSAPDSLTSIIKQGNGCSPPMYIRKQMQTKYPLLDQSSLYTDENHL